MTTFKIKNIDKFNKDLEKKVRKAIQDKNLLESLGAETLKHVKGNLQLGRDAETEKKYSKPLSSSYAKRKKEIIKENASNAGGFSKNVNNLSGQLAESLKIIISRTRPKVSLSAEGDHTPYKTKDGKDIGKKVKNKDLLKWLNEKRIVLGLSEKKKKAMLNLIKRELIRLLK